MYYDIYNQQNQQPYPTSLDTPSGGSGGGTGNIDFGDFASSSNTSSQSQSQSYGGPDEWSKEWTQNYLDKMSGGLTKNYYDWMDEMNQAESPVGTLNAKQLQDLLGNLMNTRENTRRNYDTMREDTAQGFGRMRQDTDTGTAGLGNWIEKARQLMPQQYTNEMKLFNERATQPVLNRMSNRGILNSSVTGGALSDVLRDTQAKQSDLVTKSNLWAANQNYDLGKYKNDRYFDINKLQTGQDFDINKLQTGQDYDTDMFQTKATDALNTLTGNRTLDIDKQQRDALMQRAGIFAPLIPSLLNALKYSESSSQSQSQGSSFGGLMELLGMALGGE